MKRDYYEVLGVSKDADAGKLKSAYRRLAKKYHPDANPGDKDAEQKFKEVGEAYAVLSDPEKRKLYDAYGFAAFDGTGDPRQYQNAGGAQNSGAFYTDGNGGFQSFHFDGQDAEDLFRSMFGDIFGNGTGTGSFSRTRRYGSSGGARGTHSYSSFSGTGGADSFDPFEGARSFGSFGDGVHFTTFGEDEDLDLRTSLTIDFRDAALGATKTIQLQSPEPRGKSSTLQVKIPAGIDEGKSIRLRGKGRTSAAGKKGDLLIEIHIAPDNQYTRKGLDVYTSAQIPFATAALGGEATLPTLYGNVSCKIPAGIQSGSKIRLKQKGIKRTGRSPATGDEYVEIQIAVPKNLTAAERRKLKEFAELQNGGADSGTGGSSGTSSSRSSRQAS